MKTIKRKLAGFLIFAMVLGIMAPGAVKVQAADAEGYGAVVDVDGEFVSLSGDYESAVYTDYTKGDVVVSGGSVLLDKDGKELVIKDTAWEETEGNIIDISWVSKSKATTLIFKFTKGKDVFYVTRKFAPQETGLKVGFASSVSTAAIKGCDTYAEAGSIPEKMMVGDEENGLLFFYTGKGDETALVTPSSIKWKKGASGSAKELGTAENFAGQLKNFKAKGATLYFWTKAEIIDGEEDVYVWPSKEAKYSYKKQAGAPSVKVDVNKMTIALKAGQEYRVKVGTGDYSTWLDVDEVYGVVGSNGKVKVPAILVGDLQTTAATTSAIGDKFYDETVKVQVRTSADSKKIASKAKTVTLEVVSGGATAVDIGTTTGNAIQVGYTVEYDAAKGITVTNTTEQEYEVAVVASNASVTASTKWTKLKAAATTKDGTTKNGTAKIAAKSFTAGEDDLYIRLAANKKNSELAGKATKYSLSNVKTVDRKVISATKKGDAVTGVAVDVATPNAITITVTAATTGAIEEDVTVEVDYALNKLSKAGSAKVTEKKEVTGVKFTAPKFTEDAKGTLKVVVADGTYQGTETATYTYKIEECAFSVTVKIVKAAN